MKADSFYDIIFGQTELMEEENHSVYDIITGRVGLTAEEKASSDEMFRDEIEHMNTVNAFWNSINSISGSTQKNALEKAATLAAHFKQKCRTYKTRALAFTAIFLTTGYVAQKQAHIDLPKTTDWASTKEIMVDMGKKAPLSSGLTVTFLVAAALAGNKARICNAKKKTFNQSLKKKR